MPEQRLTWLIRFKNQLLAAGGIAGLVVSIITLWSMFHLPTFVLTNSAHYRTLVELAVDSNERYAINLRAEEIDIIKRLKIENDQEIISLLKKRQEDIKRQLLYFEKVNNSLKFK